VKAYAECKGIHFPKAARAHSLTLGASFISFPFCFLSFDNSHSSNHVPVAYRPDTRDTDAKTGMYTEMAPIPCMWVGYGMQKEKPCLSSSIPPVRADARAD
jgi:hypothetical protein